MAKIFAITWPAKYYPLETSTLAQRKSRRHRDPALQFEKGVIGRRVVSRETCPDGTVGLSASASLLVCGQVNQQVRQGCGCHAWYLPRRAKTFRLRPFQPFNNLVRKTADSAK